MKELNSNIRQGELRLKIDNVDDLWCLKDIIEPGDLVRGKTERKISIGSGETGKMVRKVITITIAAEKIDFDEGLKRLRVNGKNNEEHEDVPKGTYQAIEIEDNSIITIIKKQWLSYQLKKIREACKASVSKILMVVFDRENAFFALLKSYGYEFLSELKGDVQKKDYDEKGSKNFYAEIVKQIAEYEGRFQLNRIIAASPGFWKEYLDAELKGNELKKKMTFATCSAASKEAFNELLKRKELESVLKEDRIAKELGIVEDILKEISTQGKVVYGFEQVRNAVDLGAVELLCISDGLIKNKRESGEFHILESLMKNAESMKADVIIIDSGNDAGKKLDGLGGIAAILRYKLSYE